MKKIDDIRLDAYRVPALIDDVKDAFLASFEEVIRDADCSTALEVIEAMANTANGYLTIANSINDMD